MNEEENILKVVGFEGVNWQVGEDKEFVVDAELDREPVEVDEGGGDVLPEFGASGKPWQQSSAHTEGCLGFYLEPQTGLWCNSPAGM